MPAAWDRTASRPSNCDTTVSDCAAVYSYLTARPRTWTATPEPHLGHRGRAVEAVRVHSDGHVTFVPNKSYSGPVKPKLAAFQEVPFTTDAAEYDVLQSPSSSTKIDVATCPPTGRPGQAGERRRRRQPAGLEGLHAGAAVHLGVSTSTFMNFQATDRQRPDPPAAVHPAGAGLSDEPEGNHPGPNARVRCAHHQPIGSTPVSKFLSPQGKAETSSQEGPYPFSIAKAKALLTSHGWTVAAGGTTTCTDPAKCGPGISQGKTLSSKVPVRYGPSAGSPRPMTDTAVERGAGGHQAEHKGSANRSDFFEANLPATA